MSIDRVHVRRDYLDPHIYRDTAGRPGRMVGLCDLLDTRDGWVLVGVCDQYINFGNLR